MSVGCRPGCSYKAGTLVGRLWSAVLLDGQTRSSCRAVTDRVGGRCSSLQQTVPSSNTRSNTSTTVKKPSRNSPPNESHVAHGLLQHDFSNYSAVYWAEQSAITNSISCLQQPKTVFVLGKKRAELVRAVGKIGCYICAAATACGCRIRSYAADTTRKY